MAFFRRAGAPAAAPRDPALALPAITRSEPPIVELRDAGRSYGRLNVLSGITFAVRPGELVLVTGPSGAGKTTLLRLIHGQLRPSEGAVWLAGRPLHARWRRGLQNLRRQMAMIIQEQRLLPKLSALENVMLAVAVRSPSTPRRSIRNRSIGALEAFSLGHRARALPDQLSAGERQRVAVARALATRPRLLLADEPLAGVDDENAQVIIQLLHEAAANGTAVIVASHEGGFRANKIVRLPSGKVYTRRNAPALLPVPSPRPPRRRQLAALAHNGFELVVLSGLRNWRRDFRLTAPALGTMAALLVLCGAMVMVGVAAYTVSAQQAGQASLVRVYLAADAPPAAVGSLRSRLGDDPRVASVRQVTPEQARSQAASRPGLDHLASFSSANPFPASLDVQVRSLADVGAVANSVTHDSAVDAGYPTSYDPDAYSRLQRLVWIVLGIGVGLISLFILVAYVVIANSLRTIAAARRDEVQVMRLLGARQWMVRGPFVVEGLFMGAVGGAAAAAVVASLWYLAANFGASLYSQVLPGVGPATLRAVAAGLMIAGAGLGSITALLGFRRATG